MLADHAEIGARALFGRIPSLFEIDYLSIQSGIAMTQRLVKLALFGYGRTQLQCLAVAIVREPELGLKTKSDNTEQDQKRA